MLSFSGGAQSIFEVTQLEVDPYPPRTGQSVLIAASINASKSYTPFNKRALQKSDIYLLRKDNLMVIATL